MGYPKFAKGTYDKIQPAIDSGKLSYPSFVVVADEGGYRLVFIDKDLSIQEIIGNNGINESMTIETTNSDDGDKTYIFKQGNIIIGTIVIPKCTTSESGNIGNIELIDGSVSLEKLATSIQNSLEKADNSVQTITSGSANGSISVDGNDVFIAGLGSAAYTNSSDYEIAGTAEEKVSELANGSVATNTTEIETLKTKISELAVATPDEIIEYLGIE